MGSGRCLAGLLHLSGDQPLERHPVVRAARHRRQYADQPGSSAARRAGLVRPEAVQAEPAVRREHPLVAAGRPAARRADPAVPAAGRRRRCGADRDRGRADAAAPAVARLARADGAQADSSACLSAGVRGAVLRQLGAGHVHAGPHRPSRLAARIPRARDRRDSRPEAGARRGGRRDRDRTVALDRARDAHLSCASRGGGDLVLGRRRGRTEAARELCGDARRRDCDRLPGLRLLREPGSGLRRFVAGLALRCLARLRRAVRPGHALAGGLEEAVCARGRCRSPRRRFPCADVAALPVAARRRVA